MEVAPLSQHKRVLTVENHVGEVAALSVADGVVLSVVAAFPAYQQGIDAAVGPNGVVVDLG